VLSPPQKKRQQSRVGSGSALKVLSPRGEFLLSPKEQKKPTLFRHQSPPLSKFEVGRKVSQGGIYGVSVLISSHQKQRKMQGFSEYGKIGGVRKS
jgi:hypothetical protein